MHRSKLQIYTEILCNLASRGPMKLADLCENVDTDEIELKHHLKLLVNSNLVEKEDFGKKKIFYIIKESGLKALEILSRLIKNAQTLQLHEFEAITEALLDTSYS